MSDRAELMELSGELNAAQDAYEKALKRLRHLRRLALPGLRSAQHTLNRRMTKLMRAEAALRRARMMGVQ